MWFPETMDAEEIAERIRAAARLPRSLPCLPPDIQGAADVALLQTLHNIWDIELTPPHRWRGRIVLPVKELLRRLLAPILRRQIEFNAVVARLARHTADQVEVVAEREADLRAVVAKQADELRTLRAMLASRAP